MVVARAEGGDRRRRPLGLTAKGRRRLAGLHALANRQVEEALELLVEEERGAVLRGMELYARALARRRAQREFAIRPITRRDDPAMAAVVRQVMTEYGATGPGYSNHDPEVDEMSRAYRGPQEG